MGWKKQLLTAFAKFLVFGTVVIGSYTYLQGPVQNMVLAASVIIYVLDDVVFTVLKRVWRWGRYGNKRS